MSQQAKKLLKQTIKAYQKEDGSSPIGSYRDVVTDLLHLAMKSELFQKIKECDRPANLRDIICTEGYNMFIDELETEENTKVSKIKTRDLPLHMDDELVYESARQTLHQRLKEGK